MIIRFSMVGIVTIALGLSGCHKEEEKSGGGSGTATPTEKPPTPPTPPSGGDNNRVRPPVVKDLKRYTKDLKGEGPLVATIETSEGKLHCELFEKRAPLTVANFVGLARGLHPFRDGKTGKAATRPYFDGLIFHRVMPGFMVQGGDPTGTGRGGPGYKFANESHPELKHDRPGILSMANGGRNTNGSQFFIMDGKKAQLDGGYSVFGHCKEAAVVAKLARVETIKDGRENSTPVKAPTIDKVTIGRGMPASN